VDGTSAYDEIRNLLGRYCEVMDAGDWAGLGALFAAGVLTDGAGNEVARGAEAVAALYAGMVQLYDGSPRTRHLTTNPVIEVHGDRAVCRSSFAVLQQVGDGPLAPVAAGRYRDEFVRSDGTWRFSVRAFHLDQVGDTSQHLVGTKARA
jgi:3-phenylpropionate/cinnamic acid dioxygenase small subunit